MTSLRQSSPVTQLTFLSIGDHQHKQIILVHEGISCPEAGQHRLRSLVFRTQWIAVENGTGVHEPRPFLRLLPKHQSFGLDFRQRSHLYGRYQC